MLQLLSSVLFRQCFTADHDRLQHLLCGCLILWIFNFKRLYSDWLQAGRPRGRSSSLGMVKNFHSSASSRPAIQWVPGTISSEVKWPGREADHSPSTSAETKKMWIYRSTPPYAFMALCLVS
jgi:hypothetical protein